MTLPENIWQRIRAFLRPADRPGRIVLHVTKAGRIRGADFLRVDEEISTRPVDIRKSLPAQVDHSQMSRRDT